MREERSRRGECVLAPPTNAGLGDALRQAFLPPTNGMTQEFERLLAKLG